MLTNHEQSIVCPACGQAKIPFETRQLLMGVKFSCPNCFASIGLTPESAPIVQETMQKLDSLKGQIKKNQ